MRLRLVAPVLLVLMASAGAFVLAQLDSPAAAWVVLATGLALATLTVALVVQMERRRRAIPEVERYFALAPEMVLLAGFDGELKRVNPTIREVLGYTEREALAQPFVELIHPDDRERTMEETRRVFEGGTVRAFENRMRCKDGSYKWIEWAATPIPEERVIYAIGRDVTQRRRSESEQAALQRIATLVARESSAVETFGAVTDEARGVLGCEAVGLLRFERDETATLVAQSDTPWDPPPLGTQFTLDGDNVITRVFHTGQAARVDDWAASTGSVSAMASVLGVRSAVASPVVVEGGLWGTIVAATSQDPLPAETESRIAQFTGLVATAIANGEARGALQRLADQQAALRRVATLVAEAVPPAELFSAVTKEVANVFSGLEPPLVATVIRFDADSECVLVGASRPYEREPIGSRWTPKDLYVSTLVLRTGRSARIDEADLEAAGGPDADVLRLRRFLHQVGSPVVVEGRLWGAMTLNSKEPLPPDTDQRLESFTELVATAIANAQSRAEVGRLADEQAALRRVATLVASGAEPGPVFDAIAGEVESLFGVDISAVVRFEGDESVTVMGAHGGPHSPGARVRLDPDYVVAAVSRTGQAARFDLDDSEREAPEVVRDWGVRSALATPIVVEGDLWGAITIASFERVLVPATDQRLADFGGLFATAIANTHAREQVTALAEEQAALRRVATLVATDTPSTEVFEAVATEVGTLLGTDITIVGRFDPDGTATAIGSWSAAGDGIPVGTRSALGGENVLTTVAETGKPARVDSYDDATGEAGEIARGLGWRSSIAAPIVVEGRLWGVMLVPTKRPEPFPAGAEHRLAAFTDLVATAVANTQAHDELRRFGDEQAALGRVATLVATGAAPEQVFQAVAEEASALLGLERIELVRYDDENTGTVIAASGDHPFPAGSTWSIEDPSVMGTVAKTKRVARIDDYSGLQGEIGRLAHGAGFRSAIGAPLTVEGRLWGVIVAISTGPEPIPELSETRLGQFTDLVGTAVANAESRSELAASRRRIVAASDETRRQIERNLHDGTQQRLVSLGLAVRAAEAQLPPEQSEVGAELSDVAMGLAAAVEELQEISRGIHPGILSKGGLGPALKALAHRSPIPVKLDIRTDARLAEPTEVAAYFVGSEALANAAKHSEASRIDVSLEQRDGSLVLAVRDDGRGGADAAGGSGLVGLIDRVEALGGSLSVLSQPGAGTEVTATLPIE